MLWHQQYDHTCNFKSFATVITNQSVILTILFLQCTIFRTHVYMPLLNMASTPRRSPRLAMKRTRLEAEMESPHLLSGK